MVNDWLQIGQSGKICRAAFAALGKDSAAGLASPSGYVFDFIKF
jgi:hypothetical protein